MRTILLSLFISCLSLPLFAQNFWDNAPERTITFGLIGGASFGGINVASPQKQYINPSLQAPSSLGINADISVNDYFSVRPGIFYAGKGGGLYAIYVDNQGNNVDVLDEYNLHYLEVPLTFIGHLPVGHGKANIFMGAGPYFAYALNGINVQTTFNNAPVTQKLKFGGGNGDFRQYEYGANTTFGFQAGKGWSVYLNLDIGMNNILGDNNTGIDLNSFKTTTFYIGIGQSF